MLNNIINNINFLVECNYLLGASNDPNSLYSLLQYAFTAIKIAVPCLIAILITVDFTKATASQEEKAMHEAYIKAIKRLIAGVALFFTPSLINIILELATLTGTCNIN